jgi:RNA polymerase sigma factor FliA
MARKFTGDGNKLSADAISNLAKLTTKELWECFDKNRCISVRDELFSRYSHLAVSAARSYMKRSMPYRSMLDYDDILSHANIGLIDCLHSYSTSGGTKFETWAFKRIKGSIIDGLRKIQNFPRIIARIKRELEPLQNKLRQKIFREPEISDLIEEFPDAVIAGLHITELAGNHLIFASVFNQEAKKSGAESEMSDSHQCSDIESKLYDIKKNSLNKPSATLERIELISTVNKILNRDKVEQQVIFFYYFGGMTYSEISDITGMSQALISMKKISGVNKIKQELRRNKELLDDLQGS